MGKVKTNIGQIAIAIAIIFASVMLSSNNATAAYDPNAAKIAQLEFRLSNLERQLSTFKSCANQNFTNISFWDSRRSSTIQFVRSCY